MSASDLPDELWARVLELGVVSSALGFRDLCCLAIASRRLGRLSLHPALWSALLSRDFPSQSQPSSSSSTSQQHPKSIYKTKFERHKVRIAEARRRAVFEAEARVLASSGGCTGGAEGAPAPPNSMKSMGAPQAPLQFPAIVEREEEERRRKKKRKERKRRKKEKMSPPNLQLLDPPLLASRRRLAELEESMRAEGEGMKAAAQELDNLERVRRASVALNVWQPQVVHGRQKQLVQQCTVSVDSRVSDLNMELKVCKQQIATYKNSYNKEKHKLNEYEEALKRAKYHPLQDSHTSGVINEPRAKRKKLK